MPRLSFHECEAVQTREKVILINWGGVSYARRAFSPAYHNADDPISNKHAHLAPHHGAMKNIKHFYALLPFYAP